LRSGHARPCIHHFLIFENNFLSRTDCEEECPVLENPCENGVPAVGPEGNPVHCTPDTVTTCFAGYYCHVGATPATTLAIHAACRSLLALEMRFSTDGIIMHNLKYALISFTVARAVIRIISKHTRNVQKRVLNSSSFPI
uniref:EGF-like domain-containing protein n=1 Tax=Gongylonema pulchrum TaxID=637853 RepID=A0A183EKX8_9BILA